VIADDFFCAIGHYFIVFFGEIVSTLADEQYLADNAPDPLKIDPLLLMGFQYYGLGPAAGGVFKEGLV